MLLEYNSGRSISENHINRAWNNNNNSDVKKTKLITFLNVDAIYSNKNFRALHAFN